MTAGQVSDYAGAAVLLDDLPKAQWLLGDRGYDVDWPRDASQPTGIQPCIPARKSRLELITYDKRRYRRRSRIEIMFGRLKDWRRVTTRYDRCPSGKSMPWTMVPADKAVAQSAGRLRVMTVDAGLSLGDRFCVALSQRDGLPAWTSDQTWKKIADAVDVVTIR